MKRYYLQTQISSNISKNEVLNSYPSGVKMQVRVIPLTSHIRTWHDRKKKKKANFVLACFILAYYEILYLISQGWGGSAKRKGEKPSGEARFPSTHDISWSIQHKSQINTLVLYKLQKYDLGCISWSQAFPWPSDKNRSWKICKLQWSRHILKN